MILTKEQQDFIKRVADYSVERYIDTLILPSIKISQSILESNWGKSHIGDANNYFGIKSTSSWEKNGGKFVIKETKEQNKDGTIITIKAEFRAYNNLEDCLLDHDKILLLDRYNKVRETENYKISAQELYSGGYATDKLYSQKLISLIEKYGLYEYDKKAIELLITNKKSWKSKLGEDSLHILRQNKILLDIQPYLDMNLEKELLPAWLIFAMVARVAGKLK
jgi:flagellum-specific peptidoglycan hydrolase FlgJ